MRPGPSTRRALAFDGSIVLLFALVVFFVDHVHEPWRDEIDPWLRARDSHTLRAFADALGHTGHPWGWYAILRLIAALGLGLRTVRVLHAFVAVGYAAVVMRCAPLPRTLRVTLVFGYYFVFEYAIIERAYGLGVLFVLLGCTWLVKRRWAPLVGALLVLPHLSVHAGVLAGALTIAFLVMRPARRTLLWLVPVALNAALAGWSMMPHADNVWLHNIGRHVAAPPWREAMPALVDHLFPVLAKGTTWWDHGRIGEWLGAWGSLVLLVVAFALAVASLRRVRAAISFFVAATAGLLFVYFVIYFGHARHHGYLWIAYVAAVFIAESIEPSKGRRIGFALVAALHVVAGVTALVRDVRQPFSNITAAALTIDAMRDRRAAIVGDTDVSVVQLAAFEPEPVYCPITHRADTYVIFDHAGDASDDAVIADAHRLAKERRAPSIVVLTRPLPASFGLEAKAAFTDSIVGDEDFWIYVVPAE